MMRLRFLLSFPFFFSHYIFHSYHSFICIEYHQYFSEPHSPSQFRLYFSPNPFSPMFCINNLHPHQLRGSPFFLSSVFAPFSFVFFKEIIEEILNSPPPVEINDALVEASVISVVEAPPIEVLDRLEFPPLSCPLILPFSSLPFPSSQVTRHFSCCTRIREPRGGKGGGGSDRGDIK